MSRRPWLSAVSLAVLSIVALAPVASAVDAADYVVWRQWSSGRKAIVVLEDTSAGARLSAAIKGLQNGTTYQIIGTDENGSCSSGVSSANRTFVVSVVGNTQANSSHREAYATFQIRTISGDDWKATQFIRIREEGGGTWACGQADQLTVDPSDANVVYARFASGGVLRGIVVVESLPNGRERLSVALGDADGDGTDDIQVRGSPKACGTPTGTVTFAYELKNVHISSFKSTTINVTQSELDGLRSIRIRKVTGDSGQDWFPECQKSILIGLLIE